MSTLTLVLTAVGSVVLLLFLVMKVRLHAFVALITVSICAGLFSGMPLEKIPATMEKGMGGTLGFLAIVVALGAMFGKVLHEAGALDEIAANLMRIFGPKKAHFALGVAGLICALPLFFEVAVVLLIGIAFAVARHSQGNLVKMMVSLFAGIAAAAAYLMPGPVPMLLASQLHVDFTWMIIIGLSAAVPGMLLAGPIFGSLISKVVTFNTPEDETIGAENKREQRPSFALSVAMVLLPLVLVGLKTIGARLASPDTALDKWMAFIGHPFIALLVACLVAVYFLAPRYGLTRQQTMAACSAAIQPAGIILLITGAGGVFKQVLVDSGVGKVLGATLLGTGLPIAAACFVLAAVVRILQGSATVACLTTVGLMMPVLTQMGYTPAQFSALAICISGGSIVCSHVNDAGFWLFGKFTGATEAQTLKTWTILETILGTTGAVVGMTYFYLLGVH